MAKAETYVSRFDILSMGSTAIAYTPQGFVKIPANLTRTGVLEYTQADGSLVRELRSPAEVLSQESLDSLKAATVTIGHRGLISPANVKQFSVGIVSDDISNDGRLVSGTVTVQDAQAIEQVERRDLSALSPGYMCKIDQTPGVFDGEAYDQVQTDIRYNHVALLPPGDGREGPEIALRFNGAVCIIDDKQSRSIEEPDKEGKEMAAEKKKFVVRFDSIAYELEIAEPMAASFADAIAKTEAYPAQISALEGKIAAGEKHSAELQTRLDAAESQDNIDALVNERIAVVEKAKKISPEIRCDGKSSIEIQKAALLASGFESEKLEGKNDSFIGGAFEVLSIPKNTVGVSPQPRADSADVKSPKTKELSAREKMIERGKNAWKVEA